LKRSTISKELLAVQAALHSDKSPLFAFNSRLVGPQRQPVRSGEEINLLLCLESKNDPSYIPPLHWFQSGSVRYQTIIHSSSVKDITKDRRLIRGKRRVKTNNILVDREDRRCGWDLCGYSASEVKLKKLCLLSEVVGLEREREKNRLDAGDQQQILHKWKTTVTLAKLCR
jgi:hypothetical protein